MAPNECRETLPTEKMCYSQVQYANSDHTVKAFALMNEMRKTSQLCDITLEASGTQFLAHKVVLAASSVYFAAMFTNEMLEKSKTLVTIHEVDPNAFKLLVDYAYTGQVLINENNVQTLLSAASLLQMSTIKEACCNFLLRQLQPSNCLGIWHFADAHSCNELQLTSHKFALSNFQQVALSEEFLSLSLEEVSSLVSNDHLNVANEQTVYQAVVRWVMHAPASREKHFGQLMNHVRLPLISRNFLLSQVIDNCLLRQNSEAKDLLIEAMRYHLCPEDRTEIISSRTQPRSPEGLQPYVFAVGGGSLFSIHGECEFYNPAEDNWTCIASTNQRRSRAGIASLHRHIFAVGGYNGTKDLSSVEYFDPLNNTWINTVSMGAKRSCLGLAELNGLIYAVGGFDGTSCLNSVERFDPLVCAWFSVKSLEIKRRYCRLTALDNCLYVVGGYDGANYLASVERYDPREGKWSGVAPMINRRSSCAVAAVNGKIYAMGGNDGTLCLCNAERFDPVKNTWENVASMHSRRSTHDVAQVGGLLYVLGGNDGSNSLNTVECYDPNKNKWSYRKPMYLRRSSVGATVLHCGDMGHLYRSEEITAQMPGPPPNDNLVGSKRVHKYDSELENLVE